MEEKEKIIEIEIERLRDFKEHPFQVKDDEEMRQLKDSISEYGVLNPLILKIPLGYGIEIPDGYAGYVFPRSSMAVKGLICELPPIDSGYRGEIHAIISNVSNQEHILKKNTRIGQLVITPVIIADFVFEHGKHRGKNSFGNTGI